MKYCPKCGTANTDAARFCAKCGFGLMGTQQPQQPQQQPQRSNNVGPQPPYNMGVQPPYHAGPQPPYNAQPPYNVGSQPAYTTPNDGKNVFSDIADRINKVAGLETPSEIKFNEVFSNVFKKHTSDEAEALFITGAPETTPDISTIADTWPKPWLFARALIVALLIFIGFYTGLMVYQNLNFFPGLIIFGSFITPIALLIFFWEMDAPRNVSLYRVIIMLFAGGILSLLFTMLINQFLGDYGNNEWFSAILTGLAEESAKVLAIILFIRNVRYKFILNGLLIGAAVGTGFAAFESAGYAFNIALNYGTDAMFSNIFLRAILAPGGHIAWAGLEGAALCMVKGDSEFQFSILTDWRFLRIFLLAIALHSIWDMPLPVFTRIPIYDILLTVISWIIIFSFISTGLRQITQIKRTPAQVNTPFQQQ